MKRVTVFVPTYNEKDNLPRLVSEIFDVCNSIKPRISASILIVDDSSPDGTGEIAEKLKKKYKKIHVVHRKERGRGSAGIAGFRNALKMKNDYIVEMDADFSHDPKEIPELIEKMKTADVAVGSRYVGAGKILKRSLLRNTISDAANYFVRKILSLKIKDVSGGFKCYKREVLRSLDYDKFISTGHDYSIGAETLFLINKKGFVIKEVPIVFMNRAEGKSKFNYKVMINYFFKILKLRVKYM